jgi:hypothetical protein
MFPGELRTTIELKRAIEHSSQMLEPLGTSPSLNVAFHEGACGLDSLDKSSTQMRESVKFPAGAEVRRVSAIHNDHSPPDRRPSRVSPSCGRNMQRKFTLDS